MKHRAPACDRIAMRREPRITANGCELPAELFFAGVAIDMIKGEIMNSAVRIVFVLVLALLVATAAQAQEQAFIDSMFAVERIEAVVYGSGWINNPWPQEFDLLLDFYHPIGEGIPEMLPGYVIIHGGAFWTGSRQEFQLVEMATQMAARGYVAVSVDYRLSGQAPEPSDEFQLIEDELGAVQAAAYEDCTNAYRWLVAHADSVLADAGIAAQIAPDHIAAGGQSAGAVIAMVMAWVLDDFWVTLSPPVPVVADFWGGLYGYETHMENGEAPFIIIHGTEDPAIPIEEAYNLMAQADAVGVDYEFYPVKGAGHGGFDFFTIEAAPDTTLFEKVVHFFYGQLGLGPVGIDDDEITDDFAEPDELPQLATRLEGAHPNPFNPMTTVLFTLDRTQHVKLAVFDMTGRRIVELANGTYAAGRHPLLWDGKDHAGNDVSSGTYLIQMESESSVQSSKMMLVR
jgi:acetyl esterase/lipase